MPRSQDPETDVTIRNKVDRGPGAPVDLSDSTENRYLARGELGKGGMGEVRLCDDRRCGREVAMKLARDPALHERFVYEARLQAQLEHPSIVPVYDIGTTRQSAPYFTMKRIHGVTLRQVLSRLAKGDAQTSAGFSRRRLLTAFATVCLTVHYAHTQSVLHRDLKPSNVMFGEYGELYVLDWGVARVEGAGDETPISLRLPAKGDETTPGDLVGTPGYIAPEYVRGLTADARADVYSLGAILFEILALEPLLPQGSVDAVRATLRPVDGRPSLRAKAKDIPPELDAICAKAVANDPADRFPSAKELHDAVDRFLEGDRDAERRRESSREHGRNAADLLRRARVANDVGEEGELRARAMGEVSRAIALDTANEEARRLLIALLTELPREVPREATLELARSRHVQNQLVARGASWIFFASAGFPPLASAVTRVRVPALSFVMDVLLVLAGLSLQNVARTPFEKAKPGYATVVLTFGALLCASAFAGPFFGIPSLVLANMVGFLMQPDRSRRALVVALGAFGMLIPLLLDVSGLVPPAYVFSAGKMIVENRYMDLNPTTVYVILGVVVGCALNLAIAVFFIRFRDMLSTAEERIHLYAWHLRNLVPPV